VNLAYWNRGNWKLALTPPLPWRLNCVVILRVGERGLPFDIPFTITLQLFNLSQLYKWKYSRLIYYATKFIVLLTENQPINMLHCRSNMDRALSWMILHDHTLSGHLSKGWVLLVPRFLRALRFVRFLDLQPLRYFSIFAFREVDRVTSMCYLKLTAIKEGK